MYFLKKKLSAIYGSKCPRTYLLIAIYFIFTILPYACTTYCRMNVLHVHVLSFSSSCLLIWFKIRVGLYKIFALYLIIIAIVRTSLQKHLYLLSTAINLSYRDIQIWRVWIVLLRCAVCLMCKVRTLIEIVEGVVNPFSFSRRPPGGFKIDHPCDGATAANWLARLVRYRHLRNHRSGVL